MKTNTPSPVRQGHTQEKQLELAASEHKDRKERIPPRCVLWAFLWLICLLPASVVADSSPRAPAPIPLDQLGAVASQQYQGDGLAITRTVEGARLRCAFQKLEGEATPKGLWLTSLTDGGNGDRFRVVAVAVGRSGGSAERRHSQADRTAALSRGAATVLPPVSTLPATGKVVVSDQRVRFLRPDVNEEYSVSVDGVRQDFVVLEKPGGASVPASRLVSSLAPPTEGELRLDLALSGARVEATTGGAQLVLENSGRKIAYNRLRVTDATGRELPARMAVAAPRESTAELAPENGGGLPTRRYATLAILVNDTDAVYPVRIDPTFSDANWVSLNPGGIPGANGVIRAIVADNDGNVYVGGEFTFIGTVSANRVAKWNGSSWSALGSGVSGVVKALAMSSTNLFVGGQFTTAGGVTNANHIAKWDGTAWSALGSGIEELFSDFYGPVEALAVIGTDLYAGGLFIAAGGTPAKSIAKWNGSAWAPVGSGMQDDLDMVFALGVGGTNLYVGGEFTRAGGVMNANGIARWDGNAWSALGLGISGGVYALAMSGTELYAGGDFSSAGGLAAANIAKWDGLAWSALASGITAGDSPSVRALAMIGTSLYVGGSFRTAGGVSATNIAKWDGNAWSTLDSGMGHLTFSFGSSVNALAVAGTNFYAGGDFTIAGGANANNLAKWDGGTWSALGSGINHNVWELAVNGSDLYVGGLFRTAGGVPANRIAKWDGNTWSPLGSGVSRADGGVAGVSTLAFGGSNMYVGGLFTVAGSASANHIANWDGTYWSALGSGMNGWVQALLVNGTDLYAGGYFTVAGGEQASHIAKWDGTNWSALGSGMDEWVLALAMIGTNLYAAGDFTTAGSVFANRIAKWDGSTWSALGSGMSSRVSALAPSGSNLYVGGDFTSAGGVSANYIARWDGITWSALGAGLNDTVYALALVGTNLFVAGNFTMAGGVAASRIAKWDGRTWSALGSGVGPVEASPGVVALAADGAGHLFVGGNFFMAGTKVSPYLAQVNLTEMIVGGRFHDALFSPLTGFRFTFSEATVGQPYRIQAAPALTGSNWTDFTNFTYTGPTVITDPSAGSTSNKLFRAVSP